MSETKYTPGPWKHIAVKGGWNGVGTEDGQEICKLSLSEPANADLIAVAWDCLKDAKKWLADAQIRICVSTPSSNGSCYVSMHTFRGILALIEADLALEQQVLDKELAEKGKPDDGQ